jgi:hypothetical protein
MSKRNEHCPTVLISDAPSSKDEFGAHQRLADTIAELITNEEGGKSIALEGRWGSGKSTVVKLLHDRLVSDAAIAFFLFDAWAHQGDPLRRTFLESLIDNLRRKRWVDDDLWHGRTEELARRKRVSEKTSIPELTDFGIVIAIGALFIPIGLALFISALGDGLSIIPSGSHSVSLKAVLGFVLSINPLLLCGIERWRVRRANGRATKKQSEINGWKAILVQNQVVRERTETIENPDPTSVEFEHTFVDLMDDALSVDDRRIVLVLDNLDRIDVAEARAILATL